MSNLGGSMQLLTGAQVARVRRRVLLVAHLESVSGLQVAKMMASSGQRFDIQYHFWVGR